MKPVRLNDLSPWARTAVGDAACLPLPPGYHIIGTAGGGTVLFHMYRPRWQHVVTQRVATTSAESAYRALVDMAHVDLRERTITVTTDADGYVTSITDGAA